jgi:hypothetical protein
MVVNDIFLFIPNTEFTERLKNEGVKRIFLIISMKTHKSARYLWLMPVILDTQEAAVRNQPGQIVGETLS